MLYRDVDDAMWLHAAYEMKSFGGFIPDGYDQETFDDGAKQLFGGLAGAEGCAYILEGYHSQKEKCVPVGVVVVRIFEEAIWPHVHWFSWATPRNKIEASVIFLQEMKKDAPIMILAEENSVRFFSHMARYGLLSKSKKLHKFNGENRYLYYGKRKE